MPLKVKICGLTNLPDAQAAVTSGADLLGFIFYPKSPRSVTSEQVRTILSNLDRGSSPVLTVGVFVNETLEAILRTLDDCGLDLAQLHGDEPPEMLGLGPSRPTRLAGRAYKALRPRTPYEAGTMAACYALPWASPAFLIDTYQPNLPGGTGQTGDWQAAAGLARTYPLLLAGGLTPSNVQQAVRAVRPWGVDVSSGVETTPGKKDPSAVREFIRKAKQTK